MDGGRSFEGEQRRAKENSVVIRLERRYVRFGEIFPYRFKRRAYVGRVEIPAVAVRDEKADGIARIVWNCKRLDVERSDLKVLSILEDREVHLVDARRCGDRVGRHRIREKPRFGKAVVELRNSLYMVVVAMSEHRSNNRAEVNTRDAAALQEFAAAEAAVYQEDIALRLDAIRVSRASACK